ncbi:hypothetical protein GUJ93_ZPchr0007g5907 [Zizania palustris]|uniref:RRM domain-containing protein n=1 Tax=Zizania palustris TaxID=103762 RepID=A0A8J5W5F8_ZIZPA|nr:hypothetical protein GUJ93_ZPchr0007g5907 [Zizania palustris]
MQPPPPPHVWATAPPYCYHGPPPSPPPQQQQQVAPEEEKGAGWGADGARSLWIGGLLPWMDEGYLSSCFSRSPELVSVVIKRNKQTGQSEGFGFLNFADHVTADQILQSYNGQEMPNAGRDFKLNWVTTTAPETRVADDPDHAIYVGDLAYDVTDFMLHHVFKSRYPSVKSAKVIWDRVTGRSKGYGFVLFGDVNEHRQAMTEMNGAYCSTMPMRIRPAPDKKILSHNTQGTDSDYNPNNSRLFVGSLDPSVTDEDLKQAFNPYGDIVNVKVIVGKRCGFVEYSSRASAEDAIRMLNGSQLAGQNIRISWGRPANKQDQWNGGLHVLPQRSGPDPGWCSQDPSMQSLTSNLGYGYDQQQASVQWQC